MIFSVPTYAYSICKKNIVITCSLFIRCCRLAAAAAADDDGKSPFGKTAVPLRSEKLKGVVTPPLPSPAAAFPVGEEGQLKYCASIPSSSNEICRWRGRYILTWWWWLCTLATTLCVGIGAAIMRVSYCFRKGGVRATAKRNGTKKGSKNKPL